MPISFSLIETGLFTKLQVQAASQGEGHTLLVNSGKLFVPNMKLEKHIIDRKINLMKEEGITFVVNTEIGKDIKAAQLLKEYDSVILACGASKPRDITAPGRDAKGIYFAVDFLRSVTKSLLDSELKEKLYPAYIKRPPIRS